MAEGNALGYWGKWWGGGGGEDWGTGRWFLCALRTLVCVGVGNEKGLCRFRFVSTQARQGIPWHENTDTKWVSKLDWEMLVHIQSACCFG